MSFLEKNMLLLEERVGELNFDYVEAEEGYEIKQSRTGKAVLTYQKKYMDSRIDPEREGLRFAQIYQKKIEGSNAIVLFGMGMGYTTKGFLELMNPNNFLIVYEPSWYIFKLAMENSDLSDILSDTRVAFIIGHQPESLKDNLKSFITVYNYEKLIYAASPAYSDIYLKEYKEFIESLSDAVTGRRITFETFRGLGKSWMKTIINNIGNIVESVSVNNLQFKLINKPAIVVAAGPSLDKNIQYIKEAQGKFPIICVYTAYKALQKHNIKPDIVVTVDANQTRFETDEDKKETFDVPLAYLCIANSALVKRFKGTKIYCHTEHDDILKKIMPDKFRTIDSIFVGGSVMVTALYLAAYMQSNPVIITGLDLAFTDEQGHATGTFYDRIDNNKPTMSPKDHIVYLDGINGEKVRSDIMFENYLKSTEEVVNCNKHIHFIDATEGGALIKGTEVATLKNVLERYKDSGIESKDEFFNDLFSEKLFNAEDFEYIIKNLKETYKLVLELLGYLKDGKEYSDKIMTSFTIGNPSNQERDEMIQFFYNLDDKINDIMDATPLFSLIIERIKFVLKTHQPKSEVSPEIYFAYHAFLLYREMLEVAEIVEKSMSQCLSNLTETEAEYE